MEFTQAQVHTMPEDIYKSQGTIRSLQSAQQLIIPQQQQLQLQQQQPPQIIQPQQNMKHIPLAKCRVLYLGSAVPTETINGIDAVQQPLRERYPADESDIRGIDAWLTVFSSGLQMQFIEDPSNITWFPIPTMHICAAVKAVIVVDASTGEREAKFVSLDTPGGAIIDHHPPIFSAIMRRMKGIKVLECHSFIAKSVQAAMALVQSCTFAYNHKEGWTTDPPTALHSESQGTFAPRFQSNYVTLLKAEPLRNKTSPEFFENPPENGYFYASGEQHIKTYNVLNNGAKNRNQSREHSQDRNQRGNRQVQDQQRFVSPPPRYTSKVRGDDERRGRNKVYYNEPENQKGRNGRARSAHNDLDHEDYHNDDNYRQEGYRRNSKNRNDLTENKRGNRGNNHSRDNSRNQNSGRNQSRDNGRHGGDNHRSHSIDSRYEDRPNDRPNDRKLRSRPDYENTKIASQVQPNAHKKRNRRGDNGLNESFNEMNFNDDDDYDDAAAVELAKKPNKNSKQARKPYEYDDYENENENGNQFDDNDQDDYLVAKDDQSVNSASASEDSFEVPRNEPVLLADNKPYHDLEDSLGYLP